MYTILQIIVVILLIAVSIVTLVWLFYHGLSAMFNQQDMGFPGLYNVAEKHQKRNWHLKQLIRLGPATIVIVLLSVGLYPLEREFDQQSCAQHEGAWREWDNGFKWDCTNPDEITSDNNIRVIHAQENE